MTSIGESPLLRITRIGDIAEFAGKVVVIEFEWNSYKNGVVRVWKEAEWFQYGSYGWPITLAIKSGVHGRSAITDHDLEKGAVRIRLATQEEIAKASPSYGETWEWIEPEAAPSSS